MKEQVDNITSLNYKEKVEDKLSSAYYVENPDFLMNLGVTKEKVDNKLKITFNKKGTYLKLGLVLSMIGIVAFIGVAIFERRKLQNVK